MAKALVERWVGTESWDAARENYALLKAIPAEAWTQALVDKVWEARERNHQLRTANINWKDSDVAVSELFADLPFDRPEASRAAAENGTGADIPF